MSFNVSLPFLALSLTTTGPNPKWDRVAGVSALAIDAAGTKTLLEAKVDLPGYGAELDALRGSTMEWKDLARELRDLMRAKRVIVHDASSALAVMAAEGVRLDQAPVDLAELAPVLIPGLAATNLDTLSAVLGVDSDQCSRSEAIAAIFEALLVKIAEYDDLTLERLEVHAIEGQWPFADLFREQLAAQVRAQRRVERLAPPELSFLRERIRLDELEPTGSIEPLEEGEILAVLGPNGTLAEVIAGFERRPQQEQMASAVATAINSSGQILVEAGTGTGKSLAYLVPAALAATERGQPVMLSTNTLALQDQLLRKDVPDLVAALRKADANTEVGVVAVKGRSN
jgi:hypothetical protein